MQRLVVSKPPSVANGAIAVPKMSFINFARVMLAALEGGRDATSGKVFLPQEKRCRQVTSTTSMK